MSEDEEDNRPIHVAVSGNIGAGKTTLCKQLSKITGSAVRTEDWRSVKDLPKFYHDKARYAFSCQMGFLALRTREAATLTYYDSLHAPGSVGSRPLLIHDRCGHEDMVFSATMRDQGYMREEEWETYQAIFKALYKHVYIPKPDVIVFLDVSPETCFERVSERAREAETTGPGITLEYLRELDNHYVTFVETMQKETTVLRVPWETFGDADAVWKKVRKAINKSDNK